MRKESNFNLGHDPSVAVTPACLPPKDSGAWRLPETSGFQHSGTSVDPRCPSLRYLSLPHCTSAALCLYSLSPDLILASSACLCFGTLWRTSKKQSGSFKKGSHAEDVMAVERRLWFTLNIIKFSPQVLPFMLQPNRTVYFKATWPVQLFYWSFKMKHIVCFSKSLLPWFQAVFCTSASVLFGTLCQWESKTSGLF